MESKNSNVLKFETKSASHSKHVPGELFVQDILNVTLQDMRTVGIRYCLEEYKKRSISLYQYLCSELARCYINPEKLFNPFHLDLTLDNIMNPHKHKDFIDSLNERIPETKKFIFETIELAHRDFLFSIVDDHVNNLVHAHLKTAIDNLRKEKIVDIDRLRAELPDDALIDTIRDFANQVFVQYFNSKELSAGLLANTVQLYGQQTISDMIKAGSFSAIKNYSREETIKEIYDQNIDLKKSLGARVLKELKNHLKVHITNYQMNKLTIQGTREHMCFRNFVFGLSLDEFQSLSPYLTGVSDDTIENLEDELMYHLIHSGEAA